MKHAKPLPLKPGVLEAALARAYEAEAKKRLDDLGGGPRVYVSTRSTRAAAMKAIPRPPIQPAIVTRADAVEAFGPELGDTVGDILDDHVHRDAKPPKVIFLDDARARRAKLPKSLIERAAPREKPRDRQAAARAVQAIRDARRLEFQQAQAERQRILRERAEVPREDLEPLDEAMRRG